VQAVGVGEEGDLLPFGDQSRPDTNWLSV